MKTALVIGYGSIGSRHARILTEMGVRVTVVSSREVDFAPRFKTITEALKQARYDYAVVSNKTSDHLKTLQELDKKGFRGHVLVEKPLYLKPSPEKFRFKNIFVAYNLRFHPALLELKRRLKGQKIISAFCYVGKYLPDWHPDKDYRRRYSSIKRFGGGVLRDLSHELDYLAWLLGSWKRVSAIGGRWSALELDSDDCFSLLFSTTACPAVSLQLNYLDRRSRRYLTVNTASHTFAVNLITGELEVDAAKARTFSVQRDDTYRAQHRAIRQKKYDTVCSFREGMETMHLIEAAEKASAKRQWVSR